jgi:hypothetical protein
MSQEHKKQDVIEFPADAELRQRIERAAEMHNVAVAEYVLEALERRLTDDIGPKSKNHSSKEDDDSLFDDMRDLHERILARRGGKPLDIDILEMVRSERDDELTNMR